MYFVMSKAMRFNGDKRRYIYTLIVDSSDSKLKVKCTSTRCRKSTLDPRTYFGDVLTGYEDCINMPLDRNTQWFHENLLYFLLNETADFVKLHYSVDDTILAKLYGFTRYAITPKRVGYGKACDESQVNMFKAFCDTLGLEDHWKARTKEFFNHLYDVRKEVRGY